ncbi:MULTISPECIES: SapC family protein [Alishewanella]|uniref:SapC family protein n=1 Tax=Alishewanella jeotgali KCTC 22429 TaxID=1129374 RepID=H3ZCY7_9ALTE|nr:MULTISPECIES: SapC family protein [Alishewanella]EHR41576.1 SapC family protein [Alishewanella jeotgali KCTC 22429]OCW96893.1 multidrug transporter [Alishewanella sp. HH-ZS]
MEQNKVVGLHKEKHAKTKISSVRPLSHIAQEHMLPVVVHEFVVAGAEFPVVFVKDQQSERFQPVVLLGLAAQQNLILKDDKWGALYVPRVVRNYPLVLVQDAPDSDRLIVAIDETSERVNETEGFPLFNDDGSESEFLTARKQQMGEYVDYSQMTQVFMEKLKSLDLLKEQVLTVTINGEKRNINGIHMVDDQKLNELSDETFLELRKLGYLTAIYAHLMSLQHTQKLVQKLAEREEAAKA